MHYEQNTPATPREIIVFFLAPLQCSTVNRTRLPLLNIGAINRALGRVPQQLLPNLIQET